MQTVHALKQSPGSANEGDAKPRTVLPNALRCLIIGVIRRGIRTCFRDNRPTLPTERFRSVYVSARDEFPLAAAAQNLRKLAKLILITQPQPT
jgi:hypothetical protein